MNVRAVGLLLLVFVLRPLPLLMADSDADQVARHIKRLGSNDYSERETASKALALIGDPALSGLREAANSPDAEVKWRAGKLVSQINGRAADRARAPFLALVAEVGGRITLGWDADDRVTVSVDLAGTPATDVDVKRLAEWGEMRELDLSGTKTTEDSLAFLRSAAGLRRLKLDDVQVTDCASRHLQGVTKPDGPVVGQQKQITDKAVAELRKSLPNLEVTRPGGFSPVLLGD
jgi:hypothetical protein